MKRLTAYALTAAAALATAGTIPSTANAAVNTYNFSAGGGRVIMVTGNNRMDFNNILNQIPGVNFSPDCQPVFPASADCCPAAYRPGNSGIQAGSPGRSLLRESGLRYY